jgi:hypothetical protein
MEIIYDIALFIALPLVMSYLILPLLVGFRVGNLISGIFGFWYLDALLSSDCTIWFRALSIVLVLILNGRGYNDSNNLDNRSYAIGLFSFGFLLALLKYIFS